ncbi:hypothetical protein H1R20_g3675, partial [Candolleomyces eurysporus]
MSQYSVLNQPVGIIGTGVAGLINAHVLLQDGFSDITLLTRDRSVGGTWARERIYPGLHTNNVHGEYKFSQLDMPPPERSDSTGGRLTGTTMRDYVEKFSNTFLEGKAKFRFQTEVLNIRRVKASENGEPSIWNVEVKDLQSGSTEILSFGRIILASGVSSRIVVAGIAKSPNSTYSKGCSNPKIPAELSPETAKKAGYRGLVFHTSKFAQHLDQILEEIPPSGKGEKLDEDEDMVVVVGCGKSAQEWVLNFVPAAQEELSFKAYSIPPDSPFRHTDPLFWGVRLSDDGLVRNDSFYGLVNAGAIKVIAPHRVTGYSDDGKGVLLNDGSTLRAKVVALATGYQSSWSSIFSQETFDEIGLGKHAPNIPIVDTWKYTSMKNAPKLHPDNEKWATSIYRGIVPAKNILHRDFAIAGAVVSSFRLLPPIQKASDGGYQFSANPGYTFEVGAHWISSYLQGDRMKIPATKEEALLAAEKESVWMKIRFPNMLSWVNDSYSTSLDFWTWPQGADDLLEDMYLPSVRSGGNWLTWPFKAIDSKELSTLGQERRQLRSKPL